MPTQRGARGPQGKRGARGHQGLRGKTGKAGPAGPTGPKIKGAEVLAIVKEQYFEDRFSEIQKQLDLHLRRSGELQAKLDQILRRLANDPSST